MKKRAQAALKGRNSIAQGSALCRPTPDQQALKGRNRSPFISPLQGLPINLVGVPGALRRAIELRPFRAFLISSSRYLKLLLVIAVVGITIIVAGGNSSARLQSGGLT